METSNGKIISGKEAYELIENADAIILDDDALMYPSLDTEGILEDESEDYNLNLSYMDSEGLEYSYDFFWNENNEIKIEENHLILMDDRGEPCKITILEAKTL